jgi:hypothetical protein
MESDTSARPAPRLEVLLVIYRRTAVQEYVFALVGPGLTVATV